MTADFLLGPLRRVFADPSLRIIAVQRKGGGCIHEAARVETTRGDVFAKWNDDCADDLFLREAFGLRALRHAESGLTVPEVLAAEGPSPGAPAFILMEYLPPPTAGGKGRSGGGGPRRSEYGSDDVILGRGLAALHRQSAPEFGFPVTSYCGPTRQDNTWGADWASFYAERRLLSLARELREAGRLGAADGRILEALAARLPSLLGDGAPPSLIHGDLWSGNVLVTDRGPALVDPACVYADRELEFGITTLFGGFSARFFAAYEEAWPHRPGFRERNPLYQLYHLLNHHLIFGGSYGAQAMAVARRFS